jgi:hypothetical protein
MRLQLLRSPGFYTRTVPMTYLVVVNFRLALPVVAPTTETKHSSAIAKKLLLHIREIVHQLSLLNFCLVLL